MDIKVLRSPTHSELLALLVALFVQMIVRLCGVIMDMLILKK